MWLVVGLGNPGNKYKSTRHNAGFMVVDFWSSSKKISLFRFGLRSRWGRGKAHGEEIIVLKPRTYMNLSGEAVSKARKHFRIDLDRVIVVHDDLDLALGRIKIAQKGGHGGHKGIQSIIQSLGAKEFLRVRIGIGRPEDPEEDIVDWVLSPFTGDEAPMLEQVVAQGGEVLDAIISEGVQAAMNKFH